MNIRNLGRRGEESPAGVAVPGVPVHQGTELGQPHHLPLSLQGGVVQGVQVEVSVRLGSEQGDLVVAVVVLVGVVGVVEVVLV